ncbi:DUF2752 domain-containing protein [Streptomyces zagrosensis]|uniref:DUF2752 domain-containing protein n=1 Tax=Streptomyces zagrosensis TaxID=1042984 RepID=A0A7W9Q4N7_9ACTN|nr:DUF2752 domain-containing protein [Streptomyces zagrosensis]MBB5933536.1 hypothetical protein [Streptomyces zagrosensis]
MSDQLRPSHSRVVSLPRRLAAPIGVLVGAVAAFASVAAVDPHEPGHYPACPMLQHTGLLCPGCGGLRGAYCLAHGDLAAALGANALAVAGYVACAVAWTVWCARCARLPHLARTARPAFATRPVRPQRMRRAWWSLGLLVLMFTLVRNLPYGTALAP